MKNISRGAKVLFLTLLTVVGPVNAKPIQIEIRTLPKVLHKYLGQKITTHGCFVKNHHGHFVHPCGSKDWHDATLAYDPTHKVIASVFRQPKFGLATEIEADITGTLVEQDIAWPKPGKRIFIKLESFHKVKVHEP